IENCVEFAILSYGRQILVECLVKYFPVFTHQDTEAELTDSFQRGAKVLRQSVVLENPLPTQPIRKRCVTLLAMQHKGENLPISGAVKPLNAIIFEIGLEKGVVVAKRGDNRLAVEI